MNTNVAVVLAGGKGTRLQPITYKIPKPMVPVLGIPVLIWNIKLVYRYGLREIYLVVSEDSNDTICNYFGNYYKDAKLNYLAEEIPLGTGGYLRRYKDIFKGKKFIMMNGDELKYIDLEVLSRSAVVASIAITYIQDMSDFGRVFLEYPNFDLYRRIAQFSEKSGIKQKGYISVGTYILEGTIIEYLPDQEIISIEYDMFSKVAADGFAKGVDCVKQFYPIDTVEKYAEACTYWRGYDSL